MGGVEIDNSNSRIWLVRYDEAFRVDDFRQLIADARRLNPKRYKHAVLIDFRRIQPLTATAAVRNEVARLFQENFDFFKQTFVAEARVAPSPLSRGMLTVFDWLQPKPWSINNLVTGPTAEHWLRGQLDRAGIDVPPQPVWTAAPILRSA